MKRYLVLSEFQVISGESIESGTEPVADFDTYNEAFDFVTVQSNPGTFVIRDTFADEDEEEEDEEDLDDDFFDDFDDFSDNDDFTDDDDFYDDEEDEFVDGDERLYDDDCN